MAIGGGTVYEIYQVSYVPTGLARTYLWDEKGDYGVLFSGTAHNVAQTKSQPDLIYTHSYWDKDSPTSAPGGKATLDEVRIAALSGKKYFWQATNYKKDVHGEGNYITDANNAILGNYITDTGKKPEEDDRIYVAMPISSQYGLAMQLAIDHTINEIERFYEAAKGVEIEGKKNPDDTAMTLADVLKMDKNQLEANKIYYERYPDKMIPYESQP